MNLKTCYRPLTTFHCACMSVLLESVLICHYFPIGVSKVSHIGHRALLTKTKKYIIFLILVVKVSIVIMFQNISVLYCVADLQH